MRILCLFLLAFLGLAAYAKKTSQEWNTYVKGGSDVDKAELLEERLKPDVKNFDPVIIGMDFKPGYGKRDRQLAARRITEAMRQASLFINLQETGEDTPDRWVIVVKNKGEAKQVVKFFTEYITELDDIVRVHCDDVDNGDIWNLPRYQELYDDFLVAPKKKRRHGMPDEGEEKRRKREQLKMVQNQEEGNDDYGREL
jgi:hypothetical protein